MSERNQDVVWEHGDNLYPGWRCKYCHTQKGGGGTTRLKQHLTARGTEVVHCRHVPPDIRDFFRRELDRAKKATADRAREKLRREKVAAEGNYPVQEEDEEEQIRRAMELSRAEAEYRRGVDERGGAYEHGGGSGSARGNPLQRMFGRVTSQRERLSPAVEDYNLASGGRRGMTHTRIDTGSWTQKGKNAKEAIGKAWSKFFHIAGVPGRQADNPYFVSAVRETQKWGEGIASPTGRDIDGKYLDQNDNDLHEKYLMFQAEWPLFGVTLMCDSWTGPTRMGVVNFLVYCNGVMWFHKSVDATGLSQDAAYLLKVGSCGSYTHSHLL
ncbi:unnamed protein product [Urochloa decumbens]|uniref:BED-type domain-containing protein n=1 Tax=Urochloa decumbens TaxID=240449 RepID=A0ABC9GYH2_9POAL